MPLRNGNEYLVAHKCQKCLKFYSNAEFDYLCSGCSPNFKRETPDYTERKAQLEGWLMANTLPPGDKKMTSIINFIKESVTELRDNVKWTPRSELLNLSALVIVFSVIFSLIIWGADSILSRVVKLYFNLIG